MGIMGNGFTWLYYQLIKSRIEDIEAWLVGYCWMSLDGKIGKCFALCFVCCAQVQSTPSSGHRFAAFGRPWAWCWGCCRPWPAGFGTYPTSATLRDLWRHQQASDGECIHSRQNRQTTALHGPSWLHMDPYGPFMSLLVQIRQIRIGTQACNQTGVSGYPILKTCNVCDFIGTCTRWSAKLHHHLPSNHFTPSNISCNMMKMRHATRIELGQLYLYIWWSI